MKRFWILYCIIICSSCTEQEFSYDSTVLLTINFGGDSSRATGQYNTSDENIDELYLYIFDMRSGDLEHLHQASTEEIESNKITLIHRVGTKHIHLIANPPSEDTTTLQSIGSLADIQALETDLRNFSDLSFTMTAYDSNFLLSESQTNSTSLTLERTVARICLTEIENLYDKDFTLDSVYFLDASPLSSYFDCTTSEDVEKYDRMDSGFKFQNFDTFTTDQKIKAGGKLSDSETYGTHYYLFENTSTADPTSLVITGTIEGERVYYSTALTGSISINHNYQYNVAIKITDKGTSSPEIDIFGCDAEVSIKEWSEIDSTLDF